MFPSRLREIQAGHALGLVAMDEIVSGAIDALAAGYDSPSLRLLAGLGAPLDSLEVDRFLTAAFAELHLPFASPETCVCWYAASVLRPMLAGRLDRKESMRRLADLHLARQYDDQLRGFYRLYHAKRDLETEPEQWYWPDADRTNIDQVIDTHAREWLAARASLLAN